LRRTGLTRGNLTHQLHPHGWIMINSLVGFRAEFLANPVVLPATTTTQPTTTTTAASTTATTTTEAPNTTTTDVATTTATTLEATTTTRALPTTTAPVTVAPCVYAVDPQSTAGQYFNVTFQLNYATFDCALMQQQFQALWGEPTQDLRLLATSPGSVIARFWVGDGTAGSGTAVQTYNTFASEIVLPSSVLSLQADQLGIPVLAISPAGQAPSVPWNANAIIIGAVIAGLTVIAFLVAVVILVRNRCRDHSYAKASGPSADFAAIRGDGDLLADNTHNDDLF
jgi:hypothetical protein